MTTIEADLEKAYIRTLAAGDFAAKKMGALWDRSTRTWSNRPLGMYLHELATLDANILFRIDDAKYSFKANDLAAALASAEAAESKLKESGKGVSAQMAKCWDAKTKTWIDDDLGTFFHDLLNLQAKAMNSIRFARRELAKLAPSSAN